ncbi:MAG: DUF2510 domain-containing protein [Acidimicrobiales bacterium]
MADAGQHTPPGWYPDPAGRHEYRWWDGTTWTDQAASGGRNVVDPIQAPAHGAVPTVAQRPEQVQRQVQQQAGIQPIAQGGGTLFSEPVLVVNQKAKLIEVNNEYAIFDQHGRQLGAVRQVGQSAAKKALRVLTSLDQFLTHTLQLVDMDGTVQLVLTRPAKLVKSRVVVQDGHGAEIGAIVQENAIGKIHFGLVVGASASAASTPRTGGRGTSPSATTPTPRWPASPRRGRGWPRRCSPRPTTTSCSSTGRSTNRCVRWWSPPPSAWTPPSNRTPAASAERWRSQRPCELAEPGAGRVWGRSPSTGRG